MAVNDIINGTNLRVYIGTGSPTAIGEATSATLSISRDLREILTKDSPNNGWRSVSPARKSATLTTEALYSESTSNKSPDELFDALNDGTALVMWLDDNVSTHSYYSFCAYCTQFEINTPVEENVSYTCTFEVTGAVSRGTN